MVNDEGNGVGVSRVNAYLEEQAALVRAGVYWNCLAAARELSSLLVAEGRKPWIARLRKTESRRGQVFHAPLTPRVAGVRATWTTHYVCCCDALAYDPVAGRAVGLESYASEVFGQRITPEVFVSESELQSYLAADRPPK